jgi:DNA-binding HxlR family transcriptional regulator
MLQAFNKVLEDQKKRFEQLRRKIESTLTYALTSKNHLDIVNILF